MSLDYTTYIGTYIEVYNPKKLSSKQQLGCIRLECPMYSKLTTHQFCPTCGTKIGLVDIPIQEKIHFDEYEELEGRLYEFFRESSHNGDYNVYCANIDSSKYGKSFDPCNEEYKFVFDTDTFEKWYFSFISDFQSQLLKLRSIFGTDNVKVKTGVLGSIN